MKKNYTKKVKNFEADYNSLQNNNFELIQISTFMRNRLLLDFSKTSLSKSFAFVLGLLLMTLSIEVNAQCTPDGTSPVFGGCANKVIALNPGQCSVFMQPSVYATDNCPGASLTFSHNSANTFDTAYGCDFGVTKIYQFFTANSATPISIDAVDFVHTNVVNSYDVRINIYLSNGSMVPNDWDLIGGGTAFGVTGSGIAVASTTSELINNGEEFVIEIIEPSIINGDFVVSLNSSAQVAPTFFTSAACNAPTLTDIATVTQPNSGAIVNVFATAESVIVTPSGANTYETTDQFQEGVYNLSYVATDAAGNTSACAFTLTVNGVSSPVTSISCNDLVNVSLDENCEAVVGPDEILEGGPYSCYDDYEVIVYNNLNQPIGNTLDASLIGMQLKVEVVGPNTNRCWGEILVEDKNPPLLDCFPVYTTCSGDLAPGSLLPNNITYDATLPSNKISAFDPSTNTYEIDVFGLKDVVMNSLTVMINIDHDNVSELSGTLEAPDGSFVNLFFGLSCTNQGLFITLNDNASNSYSDLQNFCGATAPAVMGEFQAENSLSGIMPQDPTGKWKISITDSAPGNGGVINELSIVLNQSGGRMPFPTMNSVTSTLISPNTYRVVGLDACGPATVSYFDQVVEMDCDSKYLKVIDRTWNAVDASGNEAIPCVQKVYVYRNGLATLKFPPNYDGIERPTFSCSDYGMTIPPPTEFGAGYPTGDFCDNIQIFEPEDTKIDICAKSYKLIRKWKVLEWCSSQVIEHTQIIKVEDKRGPLLDCQDDITLSTDPLDCTLDFTPVKPTVSDYGCSSEDEITLELSYYFAPNGIVPMDAIFTKVVGNTIFNLPVGMTFVRYTATDDCGNKSVCDQKVTVRDEVPPVAVCDQFTVVSVGSDGKAWVNALTFDDLSHDNCELVDYKVRKMTNRCVGGSLVFADKVLFCCEEVGTSIMVALQVTDKSGNSNTCMVEAKIEDKLPPYITCPEDITIDCYEDYTDLDVTKEPIAIDNCGVESLTYNDSGDVDNCGEGTIRRTWTVKDKNYSASCVQIIRLIDMDPFEYDDIDWPDDYDATMCREDLHPDNLPARYAYPRFPDKHCSLVSYEYKDQIFTFVDGSCEKILRTWTVIDWCTYNKNNPGTGYDDDGIYTDLQIIKLTNNEAPEFINCEDKMAEVYGNCRGDVTQGVAAIDDCTPDSLLKYSYVIDIDNDGIGVDLFGNGDSFTRDLPIGKHKVTWEVSDMCGNTNYCTYILMVVDGKKPTPYCLTSVTTVVMPSTGAIEIWASDFDYGSYDNCTPKEDLLFTFTSNVNSTKQTFTCEDIPDGKEMYIPITMYVHDEAGNKDFCSIGLILQDGIDDVCDDVTRYGISGKISTENNQSIGNTEVMALTMGTEAMVSRQMTGSDGTFNVNVSEGDDVNVISEKNDNIMNGISTLDLVLIQRHILSVTPFTSPYKVIAADVSNDGKVTASDLVALRKVILGIESKFPNDQKEWRFVDKSQTFSNPAKPFPFTDKIQFTNVTSTKDNVNFIGMKIGDVNGSVKANLRDNASENRSEKNLALEYVFNEENGYAYIDVLSNDLNVLSGLQIELNAGSNEIIGVEPGALNIGQGDFYIQDGALRLSFAGKEDLNVNPSEVLFKLIVKNKDNFGGIFLSDEHLSSEAYNAQYEVSEVTLQPREAEQNVDFVLMQNKPNPFAEFTTIAFILPEAGEATLEVFDVTGKKLYSTTNQFPKGENAIDVYTDQMGSTGVMYYQLSFGQFKAIKKMVNVK